MQTLETEIEILLAYLLVPVEYVGSSTAPFPRERSVEKLPLSATVKNDALGRFEFITT